LSASKRETLIAIGIGVVLTTLMTYPTIVHPASMARWDTGDAKFSIWNVAWVAHALTTDPRHVFDANIFYPHAGTLAYSEANLIAGALATIPYALSRNPIVAYNVTVFSAIVLAFVFMWALARRLTGSGAAALVAATGFAFCACVQSRTAEIQLLMIFVFPLAFLAFHRFVDAPSIARAGGLGVTLAAAGLACGYFGVFAGLAIAIAAVWCAWRHPIARQYWTGLIVAVIVAGAVVAPVFRPYLRLRAEQGARQNINLEEMQGYSADPRSYLTTPSVALGWMERVVPEGKEVLFPGLVMTLFAIAGFAMSARPGASASDRRVVGMYAVIAIFAAWASFGPQAGLFGWLAKLVPFMSFIRAPARFGILVAFGVAVVAAFGVSALLARFAPARRAAIAVALVGLTAVELFASWGSLYRAVDRVPEEYRVLATLPRGGVFEYFFPYQPNDLGRHTRYMFWSMWHWQPLINGYSDFIPGDFRDMARPVNGFPDLKSFQILKAHQAHYVVVHLDSWTEQDSKEVQDRFQSYERYLRPILKTTKTWLFEIVDWPTG
jgi:hypothetical protein